MPNEPHIRLCKYHGRTSSLHIELSNGLTLIVPTYLIEGLSAAAPEQIKLIEVSPSGQGIYFPKLDIDLYLPSMLAGFLGSRKWMAKLLGQSGGLSKSHAKSLASRANGKLGGRPKLAKKTA